MMSKLLFIHNLLIIFSPLHHPLAYIQCICLFLMMLFQRVYINLTSNAFFQCCHGLLITKTLTNVRLELRRQAAANDSLGETQTSS